MMRVVAGCGVLMRILSGLCLLVKARSVRLGAMTQA